MSSGGFVTGLLYFTVYSFSAWIAEDVYARLKTGRWVNRGFFHGPWIPIYGFGAILLVNAPPYARSLYRQFLPWLDAGGPLAAALPLLVILILLEYLAGWGLEAAFKMKWRDHSAKRLSFGSRVYLTRILYLLPLSLLLVLFAHPVLLLWLARLPEPVRALAAGLFLVLLAADAIASVRRAASLRKLMSELETWALTLYQKLRHRQEEYELKFWDYETGKGRMQQEWRRSMDEARAGLSEPGGGGQSEDKIRRANDELRDALHAMKEEIADAAERRDAARREYQENLLLRVNEELDKIRGKGELKNIYRLFLAFPDLASPSEPVVLSPKNTRSSSRAMLTPDLSVIKYLWLEVRAVLDGRFYENEENGQSGVAKSETDKQVTQDFSFLARQATKKTSQKEVETMKYVCSACGFSYDPAEGDPENNIAPGTAFEALPDDWACPLCGVGKDGFEARE